MNDVLGYWKNPHDDKNKAERYVEYVLRSEYLCNIFGSLVSRESSILELGCNVGRNLSYLYTNGYKDLTGIDISERALNLGAQTYPNLYENITIKQAEIRDFIKRTPSDAFDCVFTMAVLTHLPYSYDETIKDIARIAKKTIITIEYENTSNWKHFPRNYGTIFKGLGWHEAFVDTALDHYQLPNMICRCFLY
jgi:2-polyprenyl-3-methyl-5-hydroxy-6-metoxy-1,4-benzoquinol methylase